MPTASGIGVKIGVTPTAGQSADTGGWCAPCGNPIFTHAGPEPGPDVNSIRRGE